jgi:hypothetical protein
MMIASPSYYPVRLAIIGGFLLANARSQQHEMSSSYDLIWASSGFRAMAASIGSANLFAQLGLFSDKGSSFYGISTGSRGCMVHGPFLLIGAVLQCCDVRNDREVGRVRSGSLYGTRTLVT